MRNKLNNPKMRLLLLIAIPLLVLAAFLIFYFSESSDVSNVRVTNLTETSATIIWQTKNPTEGEVLVSEDNNWKFLEPIFSTKETYHDDRNLTESDLGELEYSSEISEDRQIHHVTVTNLKPDTDYFFRMKGNLKAFESIELSSFRTLSQPESIVEPDTIYGSVYDENDLEKSVEGVALLYLESGEDSRISNIYSSPLIEGSFTSDLNAIKNTISETYSDFGTDNLNVEIISADGIGQRTFDLNLDSTRPLDAIAIDINNKPSYEPVDLEDTPAERPTEDVSVANDNCCNVDRKCNSNLEWERGWYDFQSSNGQCNYGKQSNSGSKTSTSSSKEKCKVTVKLISATKNGKPIPTPKENTNCGPRDPNKSIDEINREAGFEVDEPKTEPAPTTTSTGTYKQFKKDVEGNDSLCLPTGKIDNSGVNQQTGHGSNFCLYPGGIKLPIGNCRDFACYIIPNTPVQIATDAIDDARGISSSCLESNSIEYCLGQKNTAENSSKNNICNNRNELFKKCPHLGFERALERRGRQVVCRYTSPTSVTKVTIGRCTDNGFEEEANPIPVTTEIEPAGGNNVVIPQSLGGTSSNNEPSINLNNIGRSSSNQSNNSNAIVDYATDRCNFLNVSTNNIIDNTICLVNSIDTIKQVGNQLNTPQCEDLKLLSVDKCFEGKPRSYSDIPRNADYICGSSKNYYCCRSGFELKGGECVRESTYNPDSSCRKGQICRRNGDSPSGYQDTGSRCYLKQDQSEIGKCLEPIGSASPNAQLNIDLFSKVNAQSAPTPEAISFEDLTSGKYSIQTNADSTAEVELVGDDRYSMQFFLDINSDGTKQENEPLLDPILLGFTVSKDSEFSVYELESGWNAISMNSVVDSVTSARDLLDEFQRQGVTAVQISSYSNGAWNHFVSRYDESVNQNTYGNNFNLIPGRGYFIRTLDEGTVVIEGKPFTSAVPVNFQAGWNLIGVQSPGKVYDAGTLLNQCKSEGALCTNISKYENQRYQSYVEDEGTFFGNNFELFNSEGYFVLNNGDAKIVTP